MTVTENHCTPVGLLEDDPRLHFGRAVATATSVVAAVRPDQLGDPTPCTEYDVRQLLGHMVTVLRRVAALGRGDDPFGMPRLTAVADDAWLEAWCDGADEVREAWWDDAVLSRTMRLPWAEGPGARILTGYLNEVSVHTWDLATATGLRPAWDANVLALAFDAVRSFPATGRAEVFTSVRAAMPPEHRGPSDPFADAVPVPDDAALIDRLVAWNGRRP